MVDVKLRIKSYLSHTICLEHQINFNHIRRFRIWVKIRKKPKKGPTTQMIAKIPVANGKIRQVQEKAADRVRNNGVRR